MMNIYYQLALLISISFAADNCYKCGGVSCFAECNYGTDQDAFELKGSWRECKTHCGAETPARDSYDNCALWYKKRCYCPSGCDNVKGNDADPVLAYDILEGYAVGVVSTLFILIVGMIVYCIFARIKTKANESYDKILNGVYDPEEIT
eukprot:UN01188